MNPNNPETPPPTLGAAADIAWDECWQMILEHEGDRMVMDPVDRGGATKFGVSLRWLQSIGQVGDVNGDGLVDVRDIEFLTQDDAELLYREHWWERTGHADITMTLIKRQLEVGTMLRLTDFAINMGAGAAVRCLQRALRNVNPVRFPVDDGILGSRTTDYLVEALTPMFDPIRGDSTPKPNEWFKSDDEFKGFDMADRLWAGMRLEAALGGEAAGYYRAIVAHHPEQARFLNGWLNRAYAYSDAKGRGRHLPFSPQVGEPNDNGGGGAA